jgi:endogenous inhibitor of DNA gyrase (YacG/DUF329 family)
MRGNTQTKPCEFCGTPVTKTGTQASQRKYWACGRSCANRLRIRLGNTPTWGENPYRGQKETRPCAVCGGPVTRYLTAQRIDRPWYCSYACMGKAQTQRMQADGRMSGGKKPRRGDTVPCAVCGTEFYRQPAYIKEGRKYCSRACNAIGQSKPVTRTCAVCGKVETVKASLGSLKHCSTACAAIGKTKRPTGRMHNGRPVIEHAQGYFLIYEPTHPAAHTHNGRVLEHRWLVEQAIGRYLTPDEQVDHINQDRQDNRLDNLQVLSAHDHTVKTNADRLLGERRLRDRLAEYERRFGPID